MTVILPAIVVGSLAIQLLLFQDKLLSRSSHIVFLTPVFDLLKHKNCLLQACKFRLMLICTSPVAKED